jgi:hypothetical protein
VQKSNEQKKIDGNIEQEVGNMLVINGGIQRVHILLTN